MAFRICSEFLAESTTEKCKAEFDGQCLRRVNCTVEEKVVLEKSELFVAYRGQEQEEEVIAQCDWQSGDFRCDPVDGYTCELLPPRYFTVSINQGAHCLSSGEFEVDAANQQPIRCDISKYRLTASDLNSPVSITTVKDTVNEAKDNTIVAGVVGAVIGGFVILLIVGVGILVWIKMCRKPAVNNPTSGSVGKTHQETTTCLNESEKNEPQKMDMCKAAQTAVVSWSFSLGFVCSVTK
ncbi:hypothetical protein C0Q70_12359 [Pomacea canaliculata]|uniref:Uncharacterized protein n=1 Tax=Pomacea canaliculata TaxID=400727 RepID=A0A2T7P1B3_POMCA|nr:hypothetical protein C0Q70_12359 [Pomacea canaliculata]